MSRDRWLLGMLVVALAGALAALSAGCGGTSCLPDFKNPVVESVTAVPDGTKVLVTWDPDSDVDAADLPSHLHPDPTATGGGGAGASGGTGGSAGAGGVCAAGGAAGAGGASCGSGAGGMSLSGSGGHGGAVTIQGIQVEVLADRHVALLFPGKPYDVAIPFNLSGCRYNDSFLVTLTLTFTPTPKASFNEKHTRVGACISIAGRSSSGAEWFGYVAAAAGVAWAAARRRRVIAI